MIKLLAYTKYYFIFSALIIIPGLVSLGLYGLLAGIDFVGGTTYEVKFNKFVSNEEIARLVGESVPEVALNSVVSTGESQILLRMSPISDDQRLKLRDALKAGYGDFTELEFETVGATLGRELLEKTLIAAAIALIAIIIFLAWAFKNIVFGLSAVVAMLHDTLVILGIFSLLGHFYSVEVDALFVAALLTILSFSVHDTVVVFDRIREKTHGDFTSNFDQVANRALNETMVRSLNNSLAIIFMLLALLFLGGASLKFFVLALLVGSISGTYSSPCIAVPMLRIFFKLQRKYAH